MSDQNTEVDLDAVVRAVKEELDLQNVRLTTADWAKLARILESNGQLARSSQYWTRDITSATRTVEIVHGIEPNRWRFLVCILEPEYELHPESMGPKLVASLPPDPGDWVVTEELVAADYAAIRQLLEQNGAAGLLELVFRLIDEMSKY
jgi:hypothetical protein